MFIQFALIFIIYTMEINYSERRSSLSAKALEDSAIIVSSATVKSRISDTDYAYRQDSNFHYL